MNKILVTVMLLTGGLLVLFDKQEWLEELESIWDKAAQSDDVDMQIQWFQKQRCLEDD